MSLVEIKDSREPQPRYVYRVDFNSAPLGQGGMGTVYRGVQIDTYSGSSRDVAIKYLDPALPLEVVDRARREADIRIKTDNLIEMIDFVEIESHTNKGVVCNYFVVSELLRGVSLLDFLRGNIKDSNGDDYPFAAKLYKWYQRDKSQFAVYIIKNILQGLFILHSNGYIHRDIDPSNIMINEDERIKVIDFGVAKNINGVTASYTDANGVLVDRTTRFGSQIGKAAYSSPEQLTGDVNNHNFTTDIYSVGITLYVILTGQLPFNGSETQIFTKVLNSPMPIGKISDRKLAKIVKKATNKKQSSRYGSAAQFIADLDKYSGKGPIIDWKLIAILGGAAIAGIGLGFLLF